MGESMSKYLQAMDPIAYVPHSVPSPKVMVEKGIRRILPGKANE
jgi:hypothetical protein